MLRAAHLKINKNKIKNEKNTQMPCGDLALHVPVVAFHLLFETLQHIKFLFSEMEFNFICFLNQYHLLNGLF